MQFEIPAKFQAQDSFLGIMFFGRLGDLKNESHFLKIGTFIYLPIQFQCKQLNALMTLGFITEDLEGTRLVHMRNATIPIGCACVMDETLRQNTLTQHFVEKRSKTTKKRKFSLT